MATTTPRRVFPITDWAPAQEAIYAESSSSSTSVMKSHTFTDQHEVVATEPRLRSLSMSLPWRHRPKSSVFHFDDMEQKFHDLALERSKSHNLDTLFDNENGSSSGHGTDKGKKSIGGMIRRASVSLKGFVHRRTSIATSTAEEHHETQRQFLRTSHAHSHTLSHNPFSSVQPHARPTTSHSTWHRLRQAASFRHSRVLYGEHLEQAGLAPPREDSPDLAPAIPVPVPGSGNEPPIIPHNTGSGARAAAAAWQNEYHGFHGLTVVSPKNNWLSPEDGQDDHESGIGIAVTSADSDIAGDDEMQDLDLVTSNGEEILGCAPEISRIDFISQLPTELAIQILAHLDAIALSTASLVSKQWSTVISSQHIWREAFLREKTATYATSGPIQPGAGLGVPPLQLGNNWRKIYRVKEEVDRRWKEGKATPVYLNGHSDSIYCLQFDEEKIITGSRDKTIRIWDMRTMECKLVIGPPEVVNETSMLFDENGQPTHYATYEHTTPTTDVTPATRTTSVPAVGTFSMHHKASILCLQYDENILVTGSSDATCIVYNVKSGYRPIRRLRHHSAAVLDLCFDDKHIVTCSKDISICVWDRATGALLKQLRGHSGPVNAVQMRGNTIVSCSGDFRVKLWNIDTGKNFREFQGHTKGLACSQFSEDGRYVASAGNDKVIRIWDANTGECLREMKAHDNLVRSLHIDSVSGRLISGSYDTDIKVFDMETGRQLLDFPKWHASWVLSAKSDYRRIVSTGQDPKILVMDFGAGVEGIEMLESSRGEEQAQVTAIAEEDENYI